MARILLLMLIPTNAVLMYDITSLLNSQYTPRWDLLTEVAKKAHYIGRIYVYNGLIWLTTAIGCVIIDAFHLFCSIWGVIVLVLLTITSFIVYRYRPGTA